MLCVQVITDTLVFFCWNLKTIFIILLHETMSFIPERKSVGFVRLEETRGFAEGRFQVISETVESSLRTAFFLFAFSLAFVRAIIMIILF